MSVTLRSYRVDDEKACAALFADPETMRFVGDGRPVQRGAAMIERIFSVYRTDPAFHIWAVEEDGEYAGHAELKIPAGRDDYELIYIIHRARWGRGLGGIVADLVLEQARAIPLPFVVATIYEANAASLAILTRRGFVRDEELSQRLDTYALKLTLSP